MLYPFLSAQFFLRWSPTELEAAVRGWIEVMVKLGFLVRTGQGTLQRPDSASPEFARLVTLGRIMGETFERYCLSALLLSEERKLGRFRRGQFEEDCRLFAERLAVLTGRNAPEFFDPYQRPAGQVALLIIGSIVIGGIGGIIRLGHRQTRRRPFGPDAIRRAALRSTLAGA